MSQNQAGFNLLVASQNRRREVDAGYASRFSGLLHVEVSQVRISQSDLKTGGGTMTDDTRGTITEVT
jgi:hypothetical protein